MAGPNHLHTVLSVRVPLTFRDEVDAVARRAGLSRSGFIMRAIRSEMARAERTQPRRAA
jgi:metal-responsive CopG/Arc/MetJ family transcriptional regulator